MTRTNKNCLFGVGILAMCGCIGLTAYGLARFELTKNEVTDYQTGIGESSTLSEPPAMPEGETSDAAAPVAPNENSTSSEPPTESQNRMAEPPAGGESENTAVTGGGTTKAAPNGQQEPPAKPESETMNGTENNAPPAVPENGPAISAEEETSQGVVEFIFRFLLALECLPLSLLIMYLGVSKFNKYSFVRTFKTKKRKIVCILGAAILTFLLGLGSNLAVNAYVDHEKAAIKVPKDAMVNNAQTANKPHLAVQDISESISIDQGEYVSTVANENVFSVHGDIDVSITNATVTKNGNADGGDQTSFYGGNSAILGKDGATLLLNNVTIATDATGANGVFSYGGSATTRNSSGDGTTINISDSKITTTRDNSGGIMTTGGGVMNATNLNVATAGVSSAAIRSDRGGGKVMVDGGTYETSGAGSPAIYATANITAKNAVLNATAAEGVVIEGMNRVALENTVLTDTNNTLNGQSTTYKNIFIYQSMSGDADEGAGEFSAENSRITTNQGDSFYVTNTDARILLSGNQIINNDPNGNFLRIQADAWGRQGDNGGDVDLTLNGQAASGNIVVDRISSLDMKLTNGSSFTGAINGANTSDEVDLELDAGSQLTLTGDCYVSDFENAVRSNSNINFNGYHLYVEGRAINY